MNVMPANGSFLILHLAVDIGRLSHTSSTQLDNLDRSASSSSTAVVLPLCFGSCMLADSHEEEI